MFARQPELFQRPRLTLGPLSLVGSRSDTAETAALRVLSVYEEGLIPVSRLPKEVAAMIERRSLEAKVNQAHAVVIAATNKRNSLREDVQRLEHELQYLPISRDRKEQEARLNAEIERAKAALAAAEARLSDAERAHAKARSAP